MSFGAMILSDISVAVHPHCALMSEIRRVSLPVFRMTAIFWTDSPRPRPNSPPDPIAIWPCTAWKPASPAWFHGSRNDVRRARR